MAAPYDPAKAGSASAEPTTRSADAQPAAPPAPGGDLDRAVFDTLLDQLPVGVGVYDRERRFLRVNQTLAALHGTPQAAHRGRRIEELLPAIDQSIPLLQQHVLDTGEPVVGLVVPVQPLGPGRPRRYWALSYARIEGGDGQALGLSGVVADVTRQHLVLDRDREVRRRTAVLNAANTTIGTSPGFARSAAELADVAVPLFADTAAVYLTDDDAPAALRRRPDPAEPIELHPAAIRGREGRLGAEPDPLTSVLPGTGLHELLTRGRARLTRTDQDRSHGIADRCLIAPLIARGALIGAARFTRAANREAFSGADVETAEELAVRAAVSIDNAQLYQRERAEALRLRRHLLPDLLPEAEGIRTALRHRPGPDGVHIGGDWFDVIPLPGRRVAIVLGDVMADGLDATGVVGQFRSATRVLAQIDLGPAAVLRELDALAQSLSTDLHLSTCTYTLYDPVSGQCVTAVAGHPPPVLLSPGGAADLIEVPVGAPLGVGGTGYEEREYTVEPGAALVLYTNGLVEGRHRDIDTGIDELLAAVAKNGPPAGPGRVDALADAVLGNVLEPRRTDDATLLVVRLDRFPEDAVASWVLTTQPTVAARSRELVRRQLQVWHLAETPVEVCELLVSELVTNALRYGRGPIGLRLLHGAQSLVCEVSDGVDTTPRLRTVQHTEEGGRGLFLVDKLSRAWGIRTTGHGKIVWFEL